MCKIGIVGFLLVALVLLSGCVPATTPPPASPPAPAPAPPVEVPPKEITPTPYPTESSAPTLTVPKAPSNPTGDTMSQESYTLYWADNSDNEEGFRIYRNNSLIATVDMNITTYQDTDLEPSTTHQYAVKAYNQAGESQASTHTASILNPTLNLTVHYIGVISAHDQEDIWDPDGEIQLLVLVTDGRETSEASIPIDGTGFNMGDFETQKINQRVFHTSSAGDYLKVSIVAYDIDSKKETLDYLSILEAFGVSGATSLKELYSLLPQEDDRIGYYESTWYAEENWGIGQYSAEGIEDLRVWFSIWSDTEPESISKPSLLPDAKIQNVDIPAQAKKSSAWFPLVYKHTITVVNDEQIEIQISWNVHSSNTGDFDNGDITIPANSSKSITERYFYETAGQIELTYTISYRDSVIDSWSGTVNVIP